MTEQTHEDLVEELQRMLDDKFMPLLTKLGNLLDELPKDTNQAVLVLVGSSILAATDGLRRACTCLDIATHYLKSRKEAHAATEA